jgi:uncharacterized protein YbgA (DUF1722 family)
MEKVEYIEDKIREEENRNFLQRLYYKYQKGEVVEVVNCKNCRHWDNEITFLKSQACAYWSPNKLNVRYTMPDDYCSSGARK